MLMSCFNQEEGSTGSQALGNVVVDTPSSDQELLMK